MRSAPEPDSLEHWARATPDAIAVMKGNASLQYGDSNDRATRVADVLAERGVAAAQKDA
jgi:non-ribosomal peptide synthetase component F